MMTPAQLARGSSHFRRGYQDRLVGNPRRPNSPLGTFACSDYVEGYLARVAEEKYELRLQVTKV